LLVVAPLSAPAVDIAVNTSQTFQTMDGFGFFGPKLTWWSSANASDFYNDAWLTMVLNDLGITIWRNEYYSEEANQDANWAKQRPAVVALKAKADALGVPLKFFWSVWSPPSAMKCEGTNGCWGTPTGTAWGQGLKGGGTLCTASQTAFGNWLKDGVQKYKDAGIDLYALSFQNEPSFCEGYNSGWYDYSYYTTVLKVVGPIVKAAFPNVKFLGAEHMLAANIDNNNSQFQWIYESQVMRDATARDLMGIWAYHGYSDGVNPTPQSEMARLWSLVRDSLARGGAKPVWMTETSGYTDDWGAGGALELAAAIHAGLAYGNMSGWVYWYGADDLVTATALTKKGYASKQFYRFVRPGAVRVGTGTITEPNLYLTAYRDAARGTFVVVAINSDAAAKSLNITGANVPANFTVYRTSATENCANIGSVAATSVSLPAQSVTTLVSGNVYDLPTGVQPAAFGTGAATQAAAGATRLYGLDGRCIASRGRPVAGACIAVTFDNSGAVLKAATRLRTR
jgi:O-glycosyl hydrolase